MGSLRGPAAVALGLALGSAGVFADPPRLVIDAGSDLSSAPGSAPRQLTTVGGRVVFTATDESDVEHLWASDGTLDGTYTVGPSCAPRPYGENWQRLGSVPGAVLFAFTCDGTGTAIWRTDGSASGTFAIHDYGPETDWIPAAPFANGLLYLGDSSCAPDGCERLNLWWTDGSPEGTRQVVDRELAGIANVGGMVAAEDRVEMVLGGPDYPPELWASGGSEETTRRVAALPAGFTAARVAEGVPFGHRIGWFGLETQLWVSDGTEAGTGPVTGFASPRSALGTPRAEADGDLLLFMARDDAGDEIWQTDGTLAGTRRLTDLLMYYALGFYSGPRSMVPLGDRIVFYAVDESTAAKLLVFDRSTGQIEELARPCGGLTGPYPCRAYLWLEQVGQRAVFPIHADLLGTLATSDGTAAGTERVARLCPAGCLQQPWAPTRVGDELFGLITPVEDRLELWSMDELGSVTFRGGGITRFGGSPWSGPLEIALAGDLALLSAGDERHGVELFRSVPGRPALELVKDLAYDGAHSTLEPGVDLGGDLYLPVNGRVLRTDGGSEGTQELLEPPAAWCDAHNPGRTAELAPVGALLLIANGDCEEGALWAYDPESGELTLLAGEQAPEGPRFEGLAQGTGSESDFLARAGEGDRLELWNTDGRPEGTVFLVGLPEYATSVMRAGETRFFTASGIAVWEPGDAALRPVEIGGSWWFDTVGTVGERGLFHAGQLGDGESSSSLIAVDGDASSEFVASFEEGVWFRAYLPLGDLALLRFTRSSDDSAELWVTDGTAVGTRRLQVSSPNPEFHYQDQAKFLVPWGDRVAFLSASAAGDTELWTTDGTEAGTRAVDRLTLDGETTLVRALAVAGDRFFVVGEPLQPDGPPSPDRAWLWTGRDEPGSATKLAEWPLDYVALSLLWDRPRALGVLGGRVFFAAAGDAGGNELWASDGTAAGTGRVADLSPGPAASYPGFFMVAGDRLYFAADDGLTGRELWSYAPGDPALCRATSTSLCLQGGRFRVEAGWMDFEGVQGQATAVPLTEDSGAFWFFDPGNVELVAKVLDGTALFGHHWVFYGALSNVRYALTVRDGLTGAAMRYVNPAGTYASVGDSAAFGPLGASTSLAPPPREEPASGAGSTWTTAGPASGACAPGPTRLCLRDGRFAVEAAWRDFQGNDGVGSATPWAGGETGTFWFFDDANVELIVKVLDGTPINGRFWVYYGALSNVEYTVTVTDTLTGVVRTYFNPAGTFASVGDVDAF